MGRLRVVVWVDDEELLDLKTRKKISINIGRTRGMMKEDVDVVGGGAIEEDTDRTGDGADPGASDQMGIRAWLSVWMTISRL